jgi:hypothetical protein
MTLRQLALIEGALGFVVAFAVAYGKGLTMPAYAFLAIAAMMLVLFSTDQE